MQVQTGPYAPTQQHGDIHDTLFGRLQEQVRVMERIEAEHLARRNALLERQGLPAVHVAARKPIA